MSLRTLNLRFLDTWHVGTGRGEGHHLDAVVARDADGLPYVPGRMLRGLLRDAMESLQAWGHGAPGLVSELFGDLVERGDRPGRSLSQAGRLTVSDARLPEAERAALAGTSAGATELRAALFRESFQTAIDGASGTARSESLRGIELVVPVTLHAELGILGDAASPGHAEHWRRLEQALPLVRALGAMKTRGHGRVVLGLEGRTA